MLSRGCDNGSESYLTSDSSKVNKLPRLSSSAVVFHLVWFGFLFGGDVCIWGREGEGIFCFIFAVSPPVSLKAVLVPLRGYVALRFIPSLLFSRVIQ